MPKHALGTGLLLASLAPALAWAQPPIRIGLEFQINTVITDDQRRPSIALGAGGHFVVAWTDYRQDGWSGGIFARRYDASATPIEPREFQVNVHTVGRQSIPSVASDAQGGFVVAWMDSGQDGSGWGVFARRYDAAGTVLGAHEFRVNAYTTADQFGPSVASTPSGDFVIVWGDGGGPSGGLDGSVGGVFGRRYDASGEAQGNEFIVNSYTTGQQTYPAVTSDAKGNFIVVWQSNGQDGSGYGIFGQRYDALGTPLGSEFQVNTYTTGAQRRLSVASDAKGNFVVVWQSSGQDGSGYGIFGRRYDALGTPVGGEFQVNSSYTTGDQTGPRVAFDANGNSVVVWESYGQDGSASGVFGQGYDVAGVRRNSEFQVNSFTTSFQLYPSLALDADGRFVVSWTSHLQDGNSMGVFGRRFALEDAIFRNGFE